ncbi:hypothetical protein [Pseudomonas sp. CLCA07]
MEEVFVVQKRPTDKEAPDGFYFRVVDTRSGEAVAPSFPNALQAEQQCEKLNEAAAKTWPHS